jgi:hypothetical protein
MRTEEQEVSDRLCVGLNRVVGMGLAVPTVEIKAKRVRERKLLSSSDQKCGGWFRPETEAE